jgi:hypothetical protein
MAAPMPDPGRVLRAIEIYLGLAYPGGTIPITVQSLMSTLRAWGGEFFRAPVFATDPPSRPTRYSLRLGNHFYPHAKLVFQQSPNQETFLFRVDTHDRHCCPPPTSPEYSAYSELMRQNQQMAESIEAAWAADGLPTFRTYLAEDLALRQAQAATK